MLHRLPAKNVKLSRVAVVLLATSCVVSGLLAGCGKKSANAGVQPAAASEQVNPTWPLVGKIISVNAGRRVLLVKHEEIKNFMPAMTMEFRVNSGDLAIAKEGQRIRATLVQYGDDYYLEKIWPDDEVQKIEIEKGSARLEASSAVRKKLFNPFLEKGEAVPEFALYDQEGRVVDSARFRGKRVVINFIYSRCPIATMCPASTLKMQTLQESARKAGISDFELISVSLDPEYDTPGVLKEYASIRSIDTKNYSFLTGPESAVKNLITQLGVYTYFEEGVLKHSLSTVLISRDGKILHREDGGDWAPEVFIEQLKKN